MAKSTVMTERLVASLKAKAQAVYKARVDRASHEPEYWDAVAAAMDDAARRGLSAASADLAMLKAGQDYLAKKGWAPSDGNDLERSLIAEVKKVATGNQPMHRRAVDLAKAIPELSTHEARELLDGIDTAEAGDKLHASISSDDGNRYGRASPPAGEDPDDLGPLLKKHLDELGPGPEERRTRKIDDPIALDLELALREQRGESPDGIEATDDVNREVESSVERESRPDTSSIEATLSTQLERLNGNE